MRSPDPRLGTAALVHAGALIVFLSWRFGGMEPETRALAFWLCLPAPVLTFLAWQAAPFALRRTFLWIAVPLGVIAVTVLVSLANPNMRVLLFDGEAVLAPREHLGFLPSTARPAEAWGDFKLDGLLILVGLNVFLAQPIRSAQRRFLWVVALNATALACVGTVFELDGATRILGRYDSPNERFFATFIYYNHWGGFAVLGMAAAGALLLSCRHEAAQHGWHHTPAPLLALMIALLFVTLPLSTARASTLAGLALLTCLLLVYLIGRRRRPGARTWAGVAGLAIALAGATGWIAREEIKFQLTKTSGQLAELRGGSFADARLPVYRDTLRLFAAEPVFGSGWHSFRYAFRRIQTVSVRLQNEQRVDAVFLDAHNDWLQLLAELGLVGGALALGTFFGIARAAKRKRWALSPTVELVAGAGCVALLACLDFPFACPAIIVTWWALLMTGAAIAFDREQQSITASRHA